MVHYQLLTNYPLEKIHHCFVEAFSDYEVKIDLPYQVFLDMMNRRGLSPELSMGAFDENNNLIGFVLNGKREWEGKLTAYDLGTGVIPDYRKQGITSQLFTKVKEELTKVGIEQYLLEVIQTNEKALKLYQNSGFQITREFNCYLLETSEFQSKETLPVQKLDQLKLQDYSDWQEFPSSWQNSSQSLEADKKNMSFYGAFEENQLIGYGIVDNKGDIPQLALHPEFREKNVAASILSAIINDNSFEKLKMLNVDDRDKELIACLENNGFSLFVKQYEMILPL